MDRLIKRFNATRDKDLMVTTRGIAYQRDMSNPTSYGEAYFMKYQGYRGTEISKAINKARVAMVRSHAEEVLDVGIGSGEFIEAFKRAKGFDVNPHAVKWLEEKGLYSDRFEDFNAFTFWDVIEHIREPEEYFLRINKDAKLFCCLPIFPRTGRFAKEIRDSKHYRPNEHFYYWTRDGFVDWMKLYGFRLLEESDAETIAGRDSITQFAFVRDLPDFDDYIDQYKHIHGHRHYGHSSKVYLKDVLGLVKRIKPKKILDYGCGRSDLVTHFYLDGDRKIARYDPAIPEYNKLPGGQWDLILCNDVMEHIPMRDVDRVLNEIKDRGRLVFFVISTAKAKANLPTGENAHITILEKTEWIRWIEEVFGIAKIMDTKWDHVLVLRTF